MKQENELPTFKLSLGLESSSTGPAPKVYLEADRGSKVVGHIIMDLADVGLTADFDPGSIRYGDPSFALAERLQPEIGRLVEAALGDSPILWLQLAAPVGNLAVLPWEAMLEPIVGQRPIVRIPNFSLALPFSADPIDFVICLSEPEAKERFGGAQYLRRLVPSLLGLPGSPPRIHLFADAETYRELFEDRAMRAAHDQVFLHDPAGASEARPKEEGAPEDVTRPVRNPWLLWIVEEMREATADVVHFVTHGYVQSGQASLAVAESPVRNEDPLWACFIGTAEVAAFLDQLGAWSVGFTSPPDNFSAIGLRQVFDDVARLRAGPVLHHEARRDQQAEELAAAYAGLFRGEPPAFRSSVSMYVHPELLSAKVSPERLSAESFAESLISETLGAPTEVSAEGPVWTMSTRRYLEQAVARLFPEEQAAPESSIQRAAATGAQEALAFVNELLSEHTSAEP